MWMLASLMLAGITSCADADSELTDAVTQSDGKTRAYDYSCTLTLEEPGTLGTLLEEKMGENAGNVQELIISGVYSETDAEYVRDNLKNSLVRVDLSEVTQFFEKENYYDNENGCWTYRWVDNHRLFQNCFYSMQALEEVVLPENILTEIGSWAFFNCTSLTQVTIPESVIKLNTAAFYCCKSLLQINIPGSVAEVGESTFRDCQSLVSMKIPSTVTSLGNSAFRDDTALESLELLASITEIPNGLCSGCQNLKELKLSETIQSISSSAFEKCILLTDFTLFKGMDTQGYACFSGCGFEEVDLTDYTTIPNSLLYGCSALKHVTLSPELTEIGSYAFYECGIKTIELPTSLTKIGNQAFYRSSLEEIEFPSSLTSIGSEAFKSSQLRTVTIPQTVKSWGSSVFYDCQRLTAVYWENSNDATDLGIDSSSHCILYLHTYNGIAPAFDTDITNVVIDDVAETIVLRSKSNYDFSCLKPFTAKKISYAMYFNDEYYYGYAYTNPGYPSNWKTIVLPFTPTKISHPEKGLLAPFNSEVEGAKPFWLRDLQGDDFVNVTTIEPNHPYIISMPYNPNLYLEEYNIQGNVTFEAENVEIGLTSSLPNSEGTSMTLCPTYINKESSGDYYGLANYYDSSIGRYTSSFRTEEKIYPFQAYVTSATARSIISMDGKRAATRVVSNDPRLKQPGKPRIDDI
jgi:hypothetical protein